jgi:hypothetical protein
MASGTTGILLNHEEIEKARGRARELKWIRSSGQIRLTARALAREGRRAEEAFWEAILQKLPQIRRSEP